jgi:hypothetical protein
VDDGFFSDSSVRMTEFSVTYMFWSCVMPGFSNSVPHCRKNNLKIVNFRVEYLREYESIFETVLAHQSVVDPGVLFDEKNPMSKIS